MASEARRAIHLAEASLRPELIERARSYDRAEPATSPPAKFRLAARKQPLPGDPDYVPGGTQAADTRLESIKLVGRTGALDLQRFDGARLTAMGGNLFNCMGDVGISGAATQSALAAARRVRRPIARAGRELADATRAALRRWAKVTIEDDHAEDAKVELQAIHDELQQDTR